MQLVAIEEMKPTYTRHEDDCLMVLYHVDID